LITFEIDGKEGSFDKGRWEHPVARVVTALEETAESPVGRPFSHEQDKELGMVRATVLYLGGKIVDEGERPEFPVEEDEGKLY
jgi:hypothetical protein